MKTEMKRIDENEVHEKLTTENEDAGYRKVEPLLYGVTDNPPWHLTLLFSLQFVLTNVGACIIMSSIITSVVCADALFTSKIFATASVMAGITTVIQTLVGTRLPIFQGPTLLGMLPYLDAKHDPRWRCEQNMTELYLTGNLTGVSADDNAWDEMWSKVQGSMLIAAFVEGLLGLTGLVGVISQFVRPVSMTSIFVLIGVYLWEVGAEIGRVHWGVSFGSLGLCMVFTLYLNWVQVPIPSWSKNSGWSISRFPFLELFPILLVILIMWPVSHVITVLGGFTNDTTQLEYKARTDIYSENIRNAPAFRFPYPGQFGEMKFDVNYIIFFIPCLLASMVESIADYHQYALACQVPPPPKHAINRGIAVEGLFGMVSALLGAGHPTTSYSNMMGIICITKVGSRLVMIVSGIIIAVIGVIGPLGAALVAIPTPVMFGPLILSISFLVGTAFYNLSCVDVTSRRNQVILGVSVYVGTLISFYLANNVDAINTDSELFNKVVTGIFKIPFITGGIISIFLDCTLAGDPNSTQPTSAEGDVGEPLLYDPPYVGAWMRRHRVFKYIPFLPGPSNITANDVNKDDFINNISTLDIKSSDV